MLINVIMKECSVLVCSILVVEEKTTLSFFDETSIDVIDVWLDDLLHFWLPIGVVDLGEGYPFLGCTGFVEVARLSYYPEVVLGVAFAAEPFVKLCGGVGGQDHHDVSGVY